MEKSLQKEIKGLSKEEVIELLKQDEYKEVKDQLIEENCKRLLEDIFDRQVLRYDESCYDKILSALSSRLGIQQKEIIILLYGLNNECPIKYTWKQTAEHVGLCTSRMSFVRKRALARLRDPKNREDGLFDYVATEAEIAERKRYLATLDRSKKEWNNILERARATIPEMNDIIIDVLDLSGRSCNCLKRAGIQTLSDLLVVTEDDLLRVRGLGRKDVDEVLEAIKNVRSLIEKENDQDGESE